MVMDHGLHLTEMDFGIFVRNFSIMASLCQHDTNSTDFREIYPLEERNHSKYEKVNKM